MIIVHGMLRNYGGEMIFTTLCANMRNERRRTARRQAATTNRVRKSKRRIETQFIRFVVHTHAQNIFRYFVLQMLVRQTERGTDEAQGFAAISLKL